MLPILDEILKLGNKVIPDKNSQMELEKKLLEVNQEIVKSNKSLLDKIVPVTFPLCVWVLVIFSFVQLGVGLHSLKTKGTWLKIPFPEEISQLAFIFACGLVGKWNIKEIFTGKKGGKND